MWECCTTVCGLDEVGRGALAGPLVAAAVILPAGFHDPAIRDSKLQTAPARERAAATIREHALAIEILAIEADEIDRIGVGEANRRIFERLIEMVDADLFIVDGTLRLASAKRTLCLIKGDQRVPAVAAASIIAKTTRDARMVRAAAMAPDYLWHKNKGYGTPEHIGALKSLGPHMLHRKSFLGFLEPDIPGLGMPELAAAAPAPAAAPGR